MNNLRMILSYCVYRIAYIALHLRQNTGYERKTQKWSCAVMLLCTCILLSGCRLFYRTAVPSADYYYLNPDKGLCTVGRVAIVELENGSSFPQISTDVTEALFHALQKKQLFGLTVVRQSDPVWRSLQLDLSSGLTPILQRDAKWQPLQTRNRASACLAGSTFTLEQLLAIREALKCNAVLIGTITDFKPYPHMVIGLRLRLIDLRDGQLLWALEQIWDSADKTTEYRIKSYFQSQMRSGFAPLREQLVAISSLKFIKFVTYEVAETL